MPTPKYVEIIDTLQHRIDGAVYRVGALMPTEAQFVQEFGTSRSTVVHALNWLRRHGWIEGIRGKGRIVLGRPAARVSHLPRRLQILLQVDRHATPLGARKVPATARLAAALARPVGTPLTARRYLLTVARATPFGLSTIFAPADLPVPRDGALFPDSAAVHQVVERIGARMSTDAETRALGLTGRRCLAVSLLTVLDTGGRPLLAVDAVLSRDVPELVSSFPLT